MVNRFPARPMEWLTAMLFPPKCLCCRRRVPPDRLLCYRCARLMPEEPYSRAVTLEDGRQVSVLAPLLYEGGYRDTLLLYKFQGYKILALRIGIPMADIAKGLPRRNWAVAYVPLSPEGLRERGYDQSELLAWQVARHNGLEVMRLLEKVKSTRVQHELGLEDRRTNLRGAYRASEKAAGRDILLIDDIVTTGATLMECAEELFRAGARSVCCICAASRAAGQPLDALAEQLDSGTVWWRT